MSSLLELVDVSLSFRGVKALNTLSFSVAQGEICALIGPNGAGKSSLLNVINGVYRADSGYIVFNGSHFGAVRPGTAARLGIGRTFQHNALFRRLSVRENVLAGLSGRYLLVASVAALLIGLALFQSVVVEPQNVLLFDDRVPYQHALYQLVLLASLAGICRAIVRDTAEEIRNRTRVYSTGTGPSDRQDPQIQQVVGQLAGLAYATESTTLRAAAAIQRVFDAKAAGPDAVKAANDAAHVEVYSAQIIVTELTQRAGSLLFNALSASAARETHALDRHWRNARTISSHNPAINKERIISDWHINGTAPPINWSIGVPIVDPEQNIESQR